MKNNKKITIIAFCLCVFLLLTFCLSFRKNNEKENRKPFETSLLNPKYNPDEILIYDNKNALELKFNGKFWTANLPTNPENQIPADQEMIKNFLEDLKNKRTVYKVADGFSENSDENSAQKDNFGFSDISAFHIIYYEYPTDLIFGNHDFSQKYRYFTSYRDSPSSSPVYEIDSDFEKYLSSSVQVWTEPYLLSRVVAEISKSSEIQSISVINQKNNQKITLNSKSEDFAEISSQFFELRKGGFYEEDNATQQILELSVEMGNKSECKIQVFETENESQYLVYENYLTKDGQNFDYKTKISGWTLQKINSLLGEPLKIAIFRGNSENAMF
jgi:hypothetical protein